MGPYCLPMKLWESNVVGHVCLLFCPPSYRDRPHHTRTTNPSDMFKLVQFGPPCTVFLPTRICSNLFVLMPITLKCQHQCCDNSVMTLAYLFSLKTKELLLESNLEQLHCFHNGSIVVALTLALNVNEPVSRG